jgi:hypothetical protein
VNGFKDRFYKDFQRFQSLIEKEGTDLLTKIKTLDLKENLESQKGHMAKMIEKKIKTFEPACLKFLEEIKKNAKKAGIEITLFDKVTKKTAKKPVKKTKPAPTAAPKKAPPRSRKTPRGSAS